MFVVNGVDFDEYGFCLQWPSCLTKYALPGSTGKRHRSTLIETNIFDSYKKTYSYVAILVTSSPPSRPLHPHARSPITKVIAWGCKISKLSASPSGQEHDNVYLHDAKKKRDNPRNKSRYKKVVTQTPHCVSASPSLTLCAKWASLLMQQMRRQMLREAMTSEKLLN